MKHGKSLDIICAGEGMMEFRDACYSNQSDNLYRSSFAGDVLNFSVYLKRLCDDSLVQFLTAIGNDSISQKLHDFLTNERIDTTLVARSKNKTIGLYTVENDETGERSFTYWRSDSAARKMFHLIDEDLLADVVINANYFYFTGITLAIIDQPSREKLFCLADRFIKNGKYVIFDPNYRPHLWHDKEDARKQIKRAYRSCNILLSSFQDEQILWNTSNSSEVLGKLLEYQIEEIVLTNGSGVILANVNGNQFQVDPVKPDAIIDTTAAGDGFNAGYISSRHAGNSPESSIIKASKQAAQIVAFSGAIVRGGYSS